MGYTHYWAYPPTHRDYARAWPVILVDTARILRRVREVGIVIDSPGGYDGIAFNGDRGVDLDHETFSLLPPQPAAPDPGAVVRAFCKTARKPYDVAVAATLLRCHLLLPQLFGLDSDGRWEQEWAHGALCWRADQPDDVATARGLVAELFDAAPTASPFTPVASWCHTWSA